MKLVGFDITTSSLQATLNFLNRHWRSTAGLPDSIFGNPTVMWTVHNGLSATITASNTTQIAERITDCVVGARELAGEQSDGGGLCLWSDDFVDWIVKNQKPNGSWGSSESGDFLSTALYMNLLGAQIPILSNSSQNGSTLQPTVPTPTNPSPTTFPGMRPTSSAILPNTAANGGQAAATSNRVRKRDRRGVTALAVSEDGSALVSASSDKRIVVWIPLTGNRRVTLHNPTGVPTGIVFSRGADTITSVGTDSVVRLWDLTSGRELKQSAGHEQPIRAVAASPDGTLLASVGEETRIMLWDQTTRKLTKILFGPKDFVSAVAFSPDSRLLATASDDARVLIFDVRAGQVMFTLLGHSGPLDAVAFSPNGTVLASAGQDTVIRLWDTVRGQQQHALSGHSAPIRTIAFSPDGKVIASAGEDTTVKLWNVATGVLDKSLAGSSGAVNSLFFDPKGRFLASATESGEITLWNATTGVKLLTIKVPTSL
jgi:WD40 repeat protein